MALVKVVMIQDLYTCKILSVNEKLPVNQLQLAHDNTCIMIIFTLWHIVHFRSGLIQQDSWFTLLEPKTRH